ncbi:hypothetical protein JXA85_07330 [Candidatus Woesearchaeota archaeon]|nr:hypothetical protein [Candidatus Woesearchaeota archaeon]
MPKFKNEEETYDLCISNGAIRKEEFNKQKIIDLKSNAKTSIESAEILIKSINKASNSWMSVYICYYEALRIYTEALLHLESLKIVNHQCLFAYLCVKYSRLEFDWNFFEKVRNKRNGANYYGERITFEDWKTIELQMKLYISTLRKEIDRRL